MTKDKKREIVKFTAIVYEVNKDFFTFELLVGRGILGSNKTVSLSVGEKIKMKADEFEAFVIRLVATVIVLDNIIASKTKLKYVLKLPMVTFDSVGNPINKMTLNRK